MDGGPSRILAEPLLPGPVHEEHGLACRLSDRPVMRRAHRHDDVELALAAGGWVEHEHAGHRARVPDGTLADALEWDVDGRLTAALLRGHRWVLPGRRGDAERLARWAADLGGGVPALARAARLEARALLERLSVVVPDPRDGDGHGDGRDHGHGDGHGRDHGDGHGTGTAGPSMETAGDRHARQVAEMAGFVAARFREPIGVPEIAAAAHLHPATASAAFRAVAGTTPGAFLRRCRLAEAQRLLLVTDAEVDGIARRAGFGSTSSFYACSPVRWASRRRPGVAGWPAARSAEPPGRVLAAGPGRPPGQPAGAGDRCSWTPSQRSPRRTKTMVSRSSWTASP